MNNKLVGGLVALLFVVSIVNTQAILNLSDQARNQQASILRAFNSSKDSRQVDPVEKVVFGNKEVGGQCGYLKDNGINFGTLLPTGVNQDLNCFVGLQNTKSFDLDYSDSQKVFQNKSSLTLPTNEDFPKVGEGMRYRIECRGRGFGAGLFGSMVGYVYLENPPPSNITVYDDNGNITMTCTTTPAPN